MTRLVLDDEVSLPEREVIIEERRMRIDNDPARACASRCIAALYPEPSLSAPDHRLAARDARAGADDAIACYQRLLHAQQRDPDRRRRRRYCRSPRVCRASFRPHPAARSAAPQARGAAALRCDPPRDEEPARRPTELEPLLSRAQLSRRGDAACYPLQILAEILAGGPGSRFHKASCSTKNWACRSPPATARPRSVWPYSRLRDPKPGVTVADIEAAVEAELHRLLRHGIAKEEAGRRDACRPPRSIRRTACRVRPTSSGPRWPSARASTRSTPGQIGSAP